MTENNHKRKLIAVAIGGVISVILFILLFKFGPTVFTRASDAAPRDIVISEITDSSAKVSWTTGIETQGVIEYGTSPTSLNFFAPETEKKKDHSVSLTLLSPATTYYFQLRIGNKKYDNGGVPWTFTTKQSGNVQKAPPVASPSPTVVKSSPTPTPTPISQVKVATPTPTTGSCSYTNCDEIKSHLGKECSTQDYIKCKKTQSSTTGTPTPTFTPTPTATATPTVTPSST